MSSLRLQSACRIPVFSGPPTGCIPGRCNVIIPSSARFNSCWKWTRGVLSSPNKFLNKWMTEMGFSVSVNCWKRAEMIRRSALLKPNCWKIDTFRRSRNSLGWVLDSSVLSSGARPFSFWGGWAHSGQTSWTNWTKFLLFTYFEQEVGDWDLILHLDYLSYHKVEKLSSP